MFRNSGWSGCNVSFVNWASMFVESVFETSLSFTYVLQMAAVTLYHVD